MSVVVLCDTQLAAATCYVIRMIICASCVYVRRKVYIQKEKEQTRKNEKNGMQHTDIQTLFVVSKFDENISTGGRGILLVDLP